MATYQALSDQELTSLLKQGDSSAFTEIYNRYWPAIFLHVRRMLADDERAQDLVQELFTWVWQKCDLLDFDSSLPAYLYSAARNRVLNEFKHDRVKISRLDEIIEYLKKDSYEADGAIRLKELSRIIEAEVEKMPGRMREIFDMSRNENLSHKEIAERLNISENTVRTQIQRALKLLRLKLNVPAAVIAIIMTALK